MAMIDLVVLFLYNFYTVLYVQGVESPKVIQPNSIYLNPAMADFIHWEVYVFDTWNSFKQYDRRFDW